MSEDFPDWLRDLAPEDAEGDDMPSQTPQDLASPLPAEEENESAAGNADWDMLGDLRGEMEVEEAPRLRKLSRAAPPVGGLWGFCPGSALCSLSWHSLILPSSDFSS